MVSPSFPQGLQSRVFDLKCLFRLCERAKAPSAGRKTRTDANKSKVQVILVVETTACLKPRYRTRPEMKPATALNEKDFCKV
jgi:hypothetical protein